MARRTQHSWQPSKRQSAVYAPQSSNDRMLLVFTAAPLTALRGPFSTALFPGPVESV